jgi:PAS domain S-box-containing protein
MKGQDRSENSHIKRMNNNRVDKAALKPTQRRLLIPFTLVLIALVAGFYFFITIYITRNIKETSEVTAVRVVDEFSTIMAEQSKKLAALEEIILFDENLRDALGSGDRERLLLDWQPVYKKLQAEYRITHFYFHRGNRENLLRVHKPEKYGDLINRHTALQAERTGKISAGIELGPLGTFTLRVVHPVYEGEVLLGYLELGKEIEDILSIIHDSNNLELVVSIAKDALDRESWESGMKMLGRQSDWERYDNSVLIYSSLTEFPPVLDRFVEGSGHMHDRGIDEVRWDDKFWLIVIFPLNDAAGSEVGHLITVQNIDAATSELKRLIALVLSVSLATLTGLLVFLYLVLRRTDAAILNQQHKLFEQNSRIRVLTDTVPALIYLKNRDHVYQTANRAFCDMVGLSPDGIAGRTDYDLFPEQKAKENFKADSTVIETGRPVWDREEHLTRTDGSEVWSLSNKAPIFDENGNVAGMVGISMNITKHKEWEKKLEEANQIINGSNSIAFTWKREEGWPVEFVTQNVERIFGYAAEEFTSGKIVYQDCIHPDDLERFRLEAEGYIAEEGSQGFQYQPYRIITKQGEVVWVSDWTFLDRNDGGEITRSRGIIEDITVRKHAEENVRALLDAPNDMIVLLTKEKSIIDANRAFADFSGIENEILKGMSYHEVLPEPMQAEWSSKLGEAIQTRLPLSFEKNVNERWHHVTYFPISGDFKTVQRIACFQRDITEQKKAEIYLLESSRIEMAEKFSSGTAHDINNIITGMLISISALESQMTPSEKQNKFLKRIRESGEKVIELTDKLLFFIQGQTISFEQVDLNDLLSSYLDYEKRHLSSEITVTFYPSPELELIEADKSQMMELFRFIFTNSLEALNSVGIIEIKTVIDGESVLLSISDNGEGMEEETLSQVFVPFYTTKFLGRGLGLSAAYGIVKSHNGVIEIDSEPGRGTVVRIRLPAQREAVP